MIRRAEIKDVDALIELLQQVLNLHQRIRPDIFKSGVTKYTKDELINLIQDEKMLIYVYEENEEILGHLFCFEEEYPETNNLKAYHSLFIDDLCVKEKARHQGIGTKLFNYIKRYAMENKIDNITLNVYQDKIDAINFYQKMGMKIKKCIYELKL